MAKAQTDTLSDFETVRLALSRFKTLALDFQYGGLGRELQLVRAALEALDRIEKPQLPGLEKTHN